MKETSLTPKQRDEKWKEIQTLAREVIELNKGHDIEFTTSQRKVDKWYKGWKGTMKPSF